MSSAANKSSLAPRALRTRPRAAFTLIELLTVIAIIAILAAIIFPVFAAVRENARRGACISNLREISSAARLYELDNRKYPDFLLSPAILADPGSPSGCATVAGTGPTAGRLILAQGTEDACTLEQAAGSGKLGQALAYADGTPANVTGGLYPEYVKSLNSFHCPNNTEFDRADATGPAAVTAPLERYLALANGTDSATNPAFRFYKFDSYDANPQVNTASADTLTQRFPNDVAFTTRYSRQWLRTVAPGADYDALVSGGGAPLTAYTSQLRWREPGDDTYLTMCSWHAPRGKMVVLFLNGTARVLDVRRVFEQVPNGGGTNPLATDFDGFRLKP